MVKLVLDTGTLAESFWDGPAKAVIGLWKSGEIILCVSQPLLREYAAIASKMGATAREKEEFVSLFSESPWVSTVGSAKRVDVIREDPTDDMFLDCAVAGGADFLITKDEHLLGLESYRGITIALPENFVKAHSVGYRH